jgi:hypothetical protein
MSPDATNTKRDPEGGSETAEARIFLEDLEIGRDSNTP